MLRQLLARNGKSAKWTSRLNLKNLSTDVNLGKPKPRVWPFYFTCGALLGGGIYLLGRTDDPEQAKLSYPLRVWGKVAGFFTSFEEPAFEKLLPDAVIDPQNPRPYTLVVDLDKFLREQGRWRIAKRPGAELFLFYAAQMFEVVVFSSLPQHEGDAIVKKLDPYGCISYSLYRFATKHRRGVYLKDISHLNRDLAKVIVLGHDGAGFAPHPENFIKLAPWSGSSTDAVLEESVDFLEMLAFSRLPDVRPVVQHYKDRVFPTDFDKAQADAFDAKQKAQKNSLQSRISGFFGLSKLKGGESATPPEDVNYWARKQERIELRRKEYGRIKELMQKQLQAELEKEKEYYAGHKMALWDLFAKGPPPPPPPPKSSS